MTIYQIRHGETENNVAKVVQGWLDSPLTESGINDARQVFSSLRLQNDPVIVSSSLGRAMQTANIGRDVLGLRQDVISDPNLRERSFGRFEGRHMSELMAYMAQNGLPQTVEGIYAADLEAFETIANVNARVGQIALNYPGRDLILIGHCLANNYLRQLKNPDTFQFYGGRDPVVLD